MVKEFSSRNLALDIKGSLARLEQAKALIAMDNTDRAAVICKEVGDANPNNIVGREAKIILKEIIDNAASSEGGEGGLTISPDVLFSAAEGAKLEQDYNDAIKAYMKVLAAAKTVQLKNEFNARTWNAIGECYTKMGRLLEAAVAHKTGYTDPDRGNNQEVYEMNAMRWYQALSNRHKETRDAFDEKRKKDAREKLVRLNVKTDLRFIIANDKFNKALTLQDKEARDKMLEEALNEFKELEKTSDLYERSLVFRARCYHEMEKYAEAIKEYDSLLAELKGAGTSGTPEKRKNRKIAQAEEAYWRAETLVKMEDHDGVLKTLNGFESAHKAQVDFFPAVVYNRMLARLGKGEFDEAEALYNELQEKYDASVRAASAAYYMGLALINKALAIRGEPDTPPSEEYKAFLKKGTEYMYKYCEQSNFDSFTNFKNVCEWYKELGLLGEEGYLETARDAYKQLLKVFKDDARYKETIESDVYRGYGEVLLALKDFQAAKPLWLKLLSQNTKNVGVLRSTANCLGGWIESDGMTYIEVPGAGMYAPDPDELREANKIYLDTALGIWQYLLRGIDDAGNKYSDEWWEAKFYIVYNCYRAGEQYPSYYERTQQIIDNQRLFRPEMGGNEWSKKFRYVEKAIKRKK
jgi:tetratricopeptide (TPR) repeat protein